MNRIALMRLKLCFAVFLPRPASVYEASPALREFAAWPTDLAHETPDPVAIPVLPQIRALAGDGALVAALVEVADLAALDPDL